MIALVYEHMFWMNPVHSYEKLLYTVVDIPAEDFFFNFSCVNVEICELLLFYS